MVTLVLTTGWMMRWVWSVKTADPDGHRTAGQLGGGTTPCFATVSFGVFSSKNWLIVQNERGGDLHSDKKRQLPGQRKVRSCVYKWGDIAFMIKLNAWSYLKDCPILSWAALYYCFPSCNAYNMWLQNNRVVLKTFQLHNNGFLIN